MNQSRQRATDQVAIPAPRTSRLTQLLGLACLGLAGCGSGEARDATMGSYLRLEPVQPVEHAASICADGPTVAGVDVSKWQNTIDWAAVANDGVDFAFIRVSDGLNYHDARFAENWAGAADNGILRGVYQFFRADEDPTDQADYLLETVGTLGENDLPPVIDVESTDDQTPATIAANIGVWIGRIENVWGVKPIIYTGRYFWQNKVQSDAFATYPLWVANWGVACPNLPNQWTDWAFWQTSATGDVGGINTDVDLDVFNGDAASLAVFGSPPVCGDGACNGADTNDTCPVDCPSCQPVPPEGRIIDDTDMCFVAGGAAQYIRVVDDAGYDGGLKWTKSWVTDDAENFGLWNLVFAQDGGYLVEAWIDGAYGDWAAVPYQVRHGAATELVIVDQNATAGWIAIGIFDFAAGGDQWVRIDDAVDDANEAGKRIVFDALRLTPELQPEPEPGDDGGDPDDADPTDPDDSESTDFDDSDAADADVPENDPIVTDSGNEIREAKQGCACNGGGNAWPAVLLLLMLRCRRRINYCQRASARVERLCGPLPTSSYLP